MSVEAFNDEEGGGGLVNQRILGPELVDQA